MISSLLLEAALRSAILALAVWAGLRVFNVRNVPAQKAAWGLVLVAAVTMPLLLPMASHWNVLPANVKVQLPADPENLLEELQARIRVKNTSTSVPAAVVPDKETSPQTALPAGMVVSEADETHGSATAEPDASSAVTTEYVLPEYIQPEPVPQRATVPQHAFPGVSTGIVLLYLAIADVFLIRLTCGLLAALRLRHTARPIAAGSLGPFAVNLDLRCSRELASPVTIFSSIVLPADYATWDSDKLRIVLAHERSHIRQGDFYLQLLAGIYAALFWISPLGWWLKRKLSDLAEAISDRAGLEESANRARYAQILLEFAAAPRPTLIGVAMARRGSLSRRIERLLNEVSFRQAFAGSRRAFVAVLLVPAALFAATVLVRVQAAGQQTPAQQAAPNGGVPVPGPAVAPAPSNEGVSTPKQISDDQAPPAAVAPAAPEEPVSPIVAPTPPAKAETPGVVMVAPRAPGAGPSILTIGPHSPSGGPVLIAPPHAPNGAARPIMILPPGGTMALIGPGGGHGAGYGYGVGQSATTESGTESYSKNGKRSGYHYWYSSNGDSYAVVKGDGSGHMSFNGEIKTSEIDKARQQAKGDFLWFTREGKAYFVDDPATLAQIEAMYKPMEDMGRQQEELGKKQEALGKQQEELGRQQERATVPTPDMSKEIAAIDEAMAKLKASQGKNMSQEQFAEIQEKLAELQSRLGEIQGQIGSKQGEFGARMGELGAKMGALGAQQGELGAKQGKLAQEADQKVKSIIDESLKNGKAHPVQ
ncbi:MAG TPA: M56 family metallopeptidase [Terracidiphilus sp.]|nr:M56 family metallopeptidase [Terracidiphilus sp.]